MTEQNNIPKYWQVKKLRELVSILGDGLHGTPKYSDDGEYFFINGNNLTNGKIIIKENTKKVKKEEYEKYKKPLNENTILVSINGTLGNIAFYNNEKVILGKSACFFNVTNSINKKYLKILLSGQEFMNYANNSATGSTIKNVSLQAMREYEIPLPPLPEQQLIVSKIEELLSDLENGKQQLLTAQQQLKVYRQSLLKWAFEGKLTNKNVKDGELPKGWKVDELRNVVEKISDGPFGSNLKSVDYIDKGIRVIRLENIGELVFRDEYKTFVSDEKYKTLKNHTVGKGDIIFSSFIIENIRTVILPDYIEKAINKADCFLVRVSEKKINKQYLAYYFSTKSMRNQLVNQIHGATRPRINTTQLKASLIPIATLPEQQLIVDELESKLTVCDNIEATISKSLLQAETLRQSILKKAFEGRLV